MEKYIGLIIIALVLNVFAVYSFVFYFRKKKTAKIPQWQIKLKYRTLLTIVKMIFIADIIAGCIIGFLIYLANTAMRGM